MNIKPSERVASVQEYYLQRKMKEVAALNAAGADIVSLGVGGPDMPPPPAAVETLCAEARRASTHGYQVTAGIREYRDAWARFYARHYGVELDPDTMIQPMIGSKEAILHITMAFINPGDIALVPDPGYPTYTSASRLAGAVVRPYSLTAENGWMPDFDALEQTPLEGVKLMWLNYPHMPTGTPALRSVFEKAVEFGRRHDIVIAHDNPYSFILNDAPMSILQVPGATDVALELDSLSTSYTERRSIAERIMTALGCTFDPSQRGLFLWGRIPDSEAGSEAMADRVLRDYRVFITPGFIFGKNGERYLRISLCAPPARLEEALRRITEK